MTTGAGRRQAEATFEAPAPARDGARRTQQERSADARAKLLAVAVALICERGFSLTTLADIAASAGMTRGAIQHHFSGRDELVLAILAEVEGQIVASFDSVSIREGRSIASRIDGLIDALGKVVQSQAYLAVLDIWISARSDKGLREPVRESMARSMASYTQLWRRSFENDLPSATIAEFRRLVVNLMRGLAISRIFSEDAPPIGPTLATCKKMLKQYI